MLLAAMCCIRRRVGDLHSDEHRRSRRLHLLLPAEQNTFRYPIAASGLENGRLGSIF
jgi:hypothetical protein